MLSLYVCSKIASLTANEIIKLDLQDEASDMNMLTVGNLMTTIKDKLNLTGLIDDYQLVCFGKKLKEDKPLTHYGIKSNAIVHLFLKSADERSADKKTDENPGKEKKAKFDQTEIQNMVIASRTALNIPSFRQMLSRLHEHDFRNNLIQCTPGLKDDPIAVAVLYDSELLGMMIEVNVIEKVLEKHPAILEAITHLATAFHEENALSGGRNLSSAMSVDQSPSVSYSLDDLSEDEEMSGGVDAPPPNGQHVMSPTTASAFAHLMQQAMLASHQAQRSQQQQQQQQQPSLNLPHRTPQQIQALQLQQLQQLQQQHQQELQQQGIRQPNNATIAFEMLRHALQLTEPSTSQQGNSSVASSPSVTNNSGQSIAPPARPDMSQQIAQMRELGLTDENVCLQALYATNGDVQAAIELIFSDTFHP